MWIDIVLPLGILGLLGLIFGLLLGFASKKFAVEKDDREEKIRAELPGANCGGCGYVGCDEYAKAVAAGEALPDLCAVGGAKTSQAISSILGVEAKAEEKKAAFVACSGNCEACPDAVEYFGYSDCAHAALLPGGGQKACSFGCLGFGTCVSACKFNAIHIENGVAVVDREACTGCGACAAVCPRHLIELTPASSFVHVSCHNANKGKEVLAVCSAGCIACGLCEKKCPQLAISMADNLPVINDELCIGCGICADVCPKKVIAKING